MDISWTESLLFGIISGLTEMLPVSSEAHQSILFHLFGITQSRELLRFFTLAGTFVAVFFSTATSLRRMRREHSLSRQTGRRRGKKSFNLQLAHDWSFLKIACIPALAVLLFRGKLAGIQDRMPILSLLLVINGLILYAPARLARGNKDSRSMSGLDGLLFGLSSALGLLPGISRIAAGTGCALSRGADPQQAFKWALVLSVPVLGALTLFQGIAALGQDLSPLSAELLVKGLFMGCVACFGANMGIRIMKAISERAGFEGFCFYCWGAALFSFILYLY